MASDKLFTDRLLDVITRGRAEAARLGQAAVGVEHLLLAILAEGGRAANVLSGMAAGTEGLREGVERSLTRDGGGTAASAPPAFTPQAEAALESMHDEPVAPHGNGIDPEHLLLAIAGQRDTPLARLLRDEFSITYELLQSHLGDRIPLDHALLRQPAVLLLQGLTVQGTRVYSYVKLTLDRLQQLKDTLDAGLGFVPQQFGEVLASGEGEPSATVRHAMAARYHMVDLPGAMEPAGGDLSITGIHGALQEQLATLRAEAADLYERLTSLDATLERVSGDFLRARARGDWDASPALELRQQETRQEIRNAEFRADALRNKEQNVRMDLALAERVEALRHALARARMEERASAASRHPLRALEMRASIRDLRALVHRGEEIVRGTFTLEQRLDAVKLEKVRAGREHRLHDAIRCREQEAAALAELLELRARAAELSPSAGAVRNGGAAVFISYRRSDAGYVAGSIYDRLVQLFGRAAVYKDIDSIPPGSDFRKHIADALRACAALVSIISPHWTSRMQEPGDLVRLELELAMERGIPIIPVLVNGAEIPLERDLPHALVPLRNLNAVALRPPPDFEADLERLIGAVRHAVADQGQDYAPS